MMMRLQGPLEHIKVTGKMAPDQAFHRGRAGGKGPGSHIKGVVMSGNYFQIVLQVMVRMADFVREALRLFEKTKVTGNRNLSSQLSPAASRQ